MYIQDLNLDNNKKEDQQGEGWLKDGIYSSKW